MTSGPSLPLGFLSFAGASAGSASGAARSPAWHPAVQRQTPAKPGPGPELWPCPPPAPARRTGSGTSSSQKAAEPRTLPARPEHMVTAVPRTGRCGGKRARPRRAGRSRRCLGGHPFTASQWPAAHPAVSRPRAALPCGMSLALILAEPVLRTHPERHVLALGVRVAGDVTVTARRA